MSWNKRFDTLRDLVLMGWDLGLLRYPSFVYGRAPGPGEAPPVLCLHTGEPTRFEAWCRRLVESGIATLTAEQYLRRVTGDAPTTEREVFLTLDDGHLSVWSVVEPLLREHGLQATVFLIPGRMPGVGDAEAARIRPNLDDVRAGRATDDEIRDAAGVGYALASWAENRLMHERGTIDFQAHTHHHRLIAVSDRIVGFVTPNLLESAHPFELAAHADESDRESSANMALPPLGTPIYASASRMSAHRACFPSPQAKAACVEHVAREGGDRFFERSDWQRCLRRIAGRHGGMPRRETPVEQRAAMAADLVLCRRTIEEALPGKSVTHLAYPWGVGCDLSTEVARECGYESAYWGRMNGRLSNREGTDPMRLARIGEDFFDLLPGERRSSLANVLGAKLARRLRKGSPYVSHSAR